MTWYKAGTVSVVQNSNTVIGTNTEFIANSRVGDAFLGPDGWWYEITNVASNTALSISPNYKGISDAAGTYALVPINGYPKALADAFNGLNNRFGPTLALLGETPTLAGIREALQLANTDGMPEGDANLYYTENRVRTALLAGLSTADPSAVTAADALIVAIGKLQAQATDKAAKGVNSDITSLSGLTTAISVAQGGTGGTSQAAARAGLGLGSAAVAAILGTVSQSGGVPIGAIIERGSNASGEYVKFADGTMICTRSENITKGPFGSLANIQYDSTPMPPVAMPATFSSVPRISVNIVTASSTTAWVGGLGAAAVNAWPGFYFLECLARGATAYNVHYVAIGRWF